MAKRTIRIGNTGDDVKELQNALAALDLYDGKVDGIFGVLTARAVLAFQKSRGLAEDGVAGSATWKAVLEYVEHAELKLEATLDPKTTTPSVEDPGGPYLLFDLYPYDLDDRRTKQIDDPDFRKVFGKPHIFGGILKATDGVAYGFVDWFVRNAKALKAVAGESYGKTWFRGGYHYLQFLADGRAQADFYCNAIEKAGGWDDGMIMPIVDIEFGGERAANRRATNDQIVACASSFAARCKERSGRRVMLYGRGAMRDRSIVSKMGCDVVWNPAYTERMVTNGLVTVGGKAGAWKLEDIGLWQYGGDGVGDADVHKLPLEIAGFGKIDMSVHVCGAKAPTIQTLRAAII